MTSRPARWWSSIRLTASSYTRGSTMLCSVSPTISLTVSTSQPGAQLRHELPHLLHLVVVGSADEVDELCVRRAQHRAAGDQPACLELAAERQRARLRDDGLVEVEEGCRRSGHRAHVLQCRQRRECAHDMGRFASTGAVAAPGRPQSATSRPRGFVARLDSIGAWTPAAPLLVSSDPLLVADVQRLSAAAGVVPEVVRDPAHALRWWSGGARRARRFGLRRRPGGVQPAATPTRVRARPRAGR